MPSSGTDAHGKTLDLKDSRSPSFHEGEENDGEGLRICVGQTCAIGMAPGVGPMLSLTHERFRFPWSRLPASPWLRLARPERRLMF
jgi:hypothetical protein